MKIRLELYLFHVFACLFLSLMEYCWQAIFLFVYIFQLTAARIARDQERNKQISRTSEFTRTPRSREEISRNSAFCRLR